MSHRASSIFIKKIYRKINKGGYIKTNIFLILDFAIEQAIAVEFFYNLINIFNEDPLKVLIEQDILNKKIINQDTDCIRPKLEFVANARRRDALVNAAMRECKNFNCSKLDKSIHLIALK